MGSRGDGSLFNFSSFLQNGEMRIFILFYLQLGLNGGERVGGRDWLRGREGGRWGQEERGMTVCGGV